MISTKEHAESDYIHYCLQQFDFKSECKVVLDCANGSPYQIAPEIFKQLSSSVITIHDQPNGLNINENCGAMHIESLKACVLAKQADIGFAFDGDGDRLIAIDHRGERVDGDEILGILALHENCSGVVGTLMTNLGLEKALRAQDILFERTPVGDRYVLNKLREKSWTLGGESSGHIINLNYARTGDGIITALQLLKIISTTQLTLHELKQQIPMRPQILENVIAQNPKQFADSLDIQNAIQVVENALGDQGRVLLRASGTESCVRVMVECEDENEAKKHVEHLKRVVGTALNPANQEG